MSASSSEDASRSVTTIPVANSENGGKKGGGGHVSLSQRTALREPTTNKAKGHVRSFCGSYHDEERILTSVIASVSTVSACADDAGVIGVEIGKGGGGSGSGGGGRSDENEQELGTVVVVGEADISGQRNEAKSGGEAS